MNTTTIHTRIDEQGLAEIILDRPEHHNAFNEQLVQELTDELRELNENETVRAVLLRGEGRSFCAGADLDYMLRSATYNYERNLAEARDIAELMRTLHELDKPTVALVHGAAFGGGIGLIACCDIALASQKAFFCFSEVKLGLVPAVISPYVIAAIGGRKARRYFLTAERFSAEEALRLGLVHELVEDEDLLDRGREIIGLLLQNGPHALVAAKQLVAMVECAPLGKGLIEETTHLIADIRTSEEGREGLGAFLEKRKPSWRHEP